MGAFATKEYQKGDLIGEYTGALYLAKDGMQLLQFDSLKKYKSTKYFFGFPERAILFKAQPLQRFAGLTLYLVGSKNCPMTYINEVREETVFDSTNSDFIELLSLQSPNFREDPLSAINCFFEETFDPNFSITTNTWTSFDDFFEYHSSCNIKVRAARVIKPTEEFLISYEKPSPELLLRL